MRNRLHRTAADPLTLGHSAPAVSGWGARGGRHVQPGASREGAVYQQALQRLDLAFIQVAVPPQQALLAGFDGAGAEPKGIGSVVVAGMQSKAARIGWLIAAPFPSPTSSL